MLGNTATYRGTPLFIRRGLVAIPSSPEASTTARAPHERPITESKVYSLAGLECGGCSWMDGARLSNATATIARLRAHRPGGREPRKRRGSPAANHKRCTQIECTSIRAGGRGSVTLQWPEPQTCLGCGARPRPMWVSMRTRRRVAPEGAVHVNHRSRASLGSNGERSVCRGRGRRRG